jgi:hypothetical protein
MKRKRCIFMRSDLFRLLPKRRPTSQSYLFYIAISCLNPVIMFITAQLCLVLMINVTTKLISDLLPRTAAHLQQSVATRTPVTDTLTPQNRSDKVTDGSDTCRNRKNRIDQTRLPVRYLRTRILWCKCFWWISNPQAIEVNNSLNSDLCTLLESMQLLLAVQVKKFKCSTHSTKL